MKMSLGLEVYLSSVVQRWSKGANISMSKKPGTGPRIQNLVVDPSMNLTGCR